MTVAGNVIAATEVAEWLYARPGPAPGIVFEDNTFVVDGSAPPVLRDGLEDLDLSRWQALGHDLGSVVVEEAAAPGLPFDPAELRAADRGAPA